MKKKLGYEIELPNRVKKYIKKIKDKRFKQLIVKAIFQDIPSNPEHGTVKHGDLAGIYTWNITYQKSMYRIAYSIINGKVIVIILVGSHENFYDQLKKLQ